MRLGIVASSGGSAFASMRAILTQAGVPLECLVVTDRPCAIETFCAQEGIAHLRIEAADNQAFSQKCADWFASQGGVDLVLLYFLRLVTASLFKKYPTFNIHPSLLPAFPGFNPIERAHQSKVRFLGASLHRVDENPDQGALIGQVTMPIRPGDSVQTLHKYSYIQKVYLSLLAVELAAETTSGTQFTDRCNPRVDNDALWEAVLGFQRQEGVEVLR